jgi:ABC-type branched-subunit amino acid transport system ATPase component
MPNVHEQITYAELLEGGRTTQLKGRIFADKADITDSSPRETRRAEMQRVKEADQMFSGRPFRPPYRSP